jgi:hypothetical protein
MFIYLFVDVSSYIGEAGLQAIIVLATEIGLSTVAASNTGVPLSEWDAFLCDLELPCRAMALWVAGYTEAQAYACYAGTPY